MSRLTPQSSVARFMAPDVDPTVRNAALKKLFSDPHFNVMDGLDVYIDDYGRPDPLPAGMLQQMVQSRALGLFDEDKTETGRDKDALSDAQAAPPTGTADRAGNVAPDDTQEPRQSQESAEAAGTPDGNEFNRSPASEPVSSPSEAAHVHAQSVPPPQPEAPHRP